jgi:hypothetical protein
MVVKRKHMIKNLLKRMIGLDKIEAATKEAETRLLDVVEKERLAKLNPKEQATESKEPWVGVLQTHVAKDDIKNGFFELDWNEFFVLQLRQAGYSGATDEEVVDQWFQELCRNIGNEAGIDMSRRGSGFVNRALRDDGRTEVY